MKKITPKTVVHLPQLPIYCVLEFCSQTDINQIYRSKYGFFNCVIISELLTNGLRGDEDKVKMSLQQSPEMMFETGEGSDRSGRLFSNVTLIQAMKWAHDVDMLKMMFSCIDSSLDKDNLRKRFISDYNSESNVSYILAEKAYEEACYPLAMPIDEHIIYKDMVDNQCNLSELTQQWCKIGMVHKNVPANIPQLLLSCLATSRNGRLDADQGRYWAPTFDKILSRDLLYTLYIGLDKAPLINWFSDFKDKKLGIDFAVTYTHGFIKPIPPPYNLALSLSIDYVVYLWEKLIAAKIASVKAFEAHLRAFPAEVQINTMTRV